MVKALFNIVGGVMAVRVKNTMTSKVCEGDSGGLNFYPCCIEKLMKEWEQNNTFDKIFEQVKKIECGCLTMFGLDSNRENLKDFISFFIYLFSSCKNIGDVVSTRERLGIEYEKLATQYEKQLKEIYKTEERMMGLIEKEKCNFFQFGLIEPCTKEMVYKTLGNKIDSEALEKAVKFQQRVIMNRGVISTEIMEEFGTGFPSIQCQGFRIKTGAFQEFIEKSNTFAHQASKLNEYMVKMDSLAKDCDSLDSELKSDVKKCEEHIKEHIKEHRHNYALYKCLCCVVLESVRSLKSFNQY